MWHVLPVVLPAAHLLSSEPSRCCFWQRLLPPGLGGLPPLPWPPCSPQVGKDRASPSQGLRAQGLLGCLVQSRLLEHLQSRPASEHGAGRTPPPTQCRGLRNDSAVRRSQGCAHRSSATPTSGGRGEWGGQLSPESHRDLSCGQATVGRLEQTWGAKSQGRGLRQKSR